MEQREPNTDFQKFQDLARKLVQVPKAEADVEERKYQEERKRKKVIKKPARRKRARKAH